MLRPVTPADTDALVELTAGTGFFKPLEVEALREVLDDYHGGNADLGHVALTWEDFGGRINGFVYYAPAAMTDRAWYLYWIAVRHDCQGLGIGGQMLYAVEQHLAAEGGRLLLIETSSTPHYEPTRRFYLKHGYALAATIPDYYADGDGMCVFSKRLAPPAG
jgi:ribosomal protein S18 acetylase RimI-like enzyme